MRMYLEDFIKAAGEGDLPAMERLIALAPNMVQDMVRANNFEAFRMAARNGHLHVMERLTQLAPDKVQDMLRTKVFEAFRMAASNGHLHVIERLMTLAPDNMQDMLYSDGFGAFREAASNGHLHVMEGLMTLAPDNIQDMVCANNFAAFREAAHNGHLHVIERLIALAPDNIQGMVRANDFFAFQRAAGYSHLHVMERLIELAPARVQDMVRAGFFFAFQKAAERGHLHVMERLIELAPNNVQDMVSARNCGAFRMAASNGHLHVTNRLMAFADVFDNLEMHVREYGQFVQPFINNLLVNLRQEIAAFNTINPNDVFDVIDNESARLYFYIMRNLIRQNTPASLNEILLLLSIPSVKALAHQAVTPNQPNELLRLAMSLGNQEAASILLNIPAVQALAATANFYQDEQQNGLDLRALASDRESSMRALTQGEQQRLEGANQKYHPEINRLGAPRIISELKDLLIERYRANPAKVKTEDGKLIALPLEFDKLASLPADTKAQALKSYYQHPDHSAYRYLSKPNPWMSKNAAYVHRDGEDAWSTFEEYQPLISLMYLAAKDEDIPAINGHTIETRIEHFIQELALIGRAHNWDTSRSNRVTGASEEFDDLEGDKPSCYSGVKRRLFQAVQGHPLLALLTTDIIRQDVRDIVRDHFSKSITDENCAALQQAWQAIIEGQTDNSSILDVLNFSIEEQAQHITSICQKYGPRLDEALKAHLCATFNIESPFKNLAEKFGGETDLIGILEQKQAILTSPVPFNAELRASPIRFFEPRNTEETSTPKNSGQNNLKKMG